MIYSGKLEIYFNLPESRTERNKKMFAKVLEFIGGIAFAVIGLSGWIILIKNNAQGDLAFIVCVFMIAMFMTGVCMIAHVAGFIED